MTKTKTQPESTPPSTGESTPPFHGRPWLVGIVVLYLIFAVAYNLVTPAASSFQHNPDENGHMRYVQTLASGHLPVFTTAAAGPEFHQPPLYYLLCVPVYVATKSLGDDKATHAVRAVSTALGIFLILATYRCVRRLFPKEGWAAILSAGFVALLPMNVAMNASVGNDSLTNLLVAVGLMLLVTKATSPGAMPIAPDGHADAARSAGNDQARKSILLGVVLGLIILTKSSALVLFAAVLMTFALLGYRNVFPAAVAVRCAAVAVGVGLLVGSPWLIRNALLYGDPLGTKLFLKSFTGTTMTTDTMLRSHLVDGFGQYEALVAKWTFASFWGVFDSMTAFWNRDPHPVLMRVPPYAPVGPPFGEPLGPIYLACLGLTFMAVIGVFLYLRRAKPSTSQSSIVWAMFVLILATGYGFLMFTMQFFQAQGRYWFASLVPFALLFALGIRGIFPRDAWYRAASILLILALVVLNAYTIWGLLIPRFAGS